MSDAFIIAANAFFTLSAVFLVACVEWALTMSRHRNAMRSPAGEAAMERRRHNALRWRGGRSAFHPDLR